MKPWWLLATVPLLVAAGDGDYAHQWPLQMQMADAGAYRVVLDEAVYQQVQSPGLDDLDVLDAQGRPVPAAMIDPPAAQTSGTRTVELPWFPLPASEREKRDIAAISEIVVDGNLRRVEWRTAGTGDAVGNGVLLDASRLGEPVQALRVQWTAVQTPFDLAVRVSASDNLKDWHTVADEAHLVELANAGRRVQRDRIELTPVKARYLRMMPLDAHASALPLSAVTAELASAQATPEWHWRTLEGVRAAAPDGAVHFEFALDGRFPIERADVALPGNSTGQWRLQARETTDAPWRDVTTSWTAFRIEQAGQVEASPPQTLSGVHRDRHWRLTPHSGALTAEAPQLRLGYRPEAMVFLAQGQAPFRLVAGSGRAHRAQAPLAQTVAAMRAKRGPQWQPAPATLGASTVLGGAQALTPEPAQRDWKAWLLWGLLVSGALLVAGFALSLLRKA